MKNLFLFTLLIGNLYAQPMVKPEWHPGTTPDGEAMRILMQRDPLHANLASYINRTYRLPRQLPVLYQEHDKTNAWYSPFQNRIVLSYKLGSFLLRFFKSKNVSHAERQTQATLDFILLHELGHALIHELDLPIVGREEDAADEFATLVGLDALSDQGTDQAIAAAEWFRLMGNSEVSLHEMEFWDEHSLNSQRFYKILCFLYGSNPQGLHPIVSPVVPYTRLQTAQQRFPQKVTRWRRLLAAHQVTPSNYRLEGLLPDPTKPRSLTFEQLPAGTLAPIAELNRRANINSTVQLLDRSFKLPKNLTVALKRTGLQKNAFLPVTGTILLSQDFFDSAKSRLERRFGQSEADHTMSALERFSVLQEFAFALITDADLAITGEPEDAAAELAMLIVVSEPTMRPIGKAMTNWYQTLAADKVNVLELKYWSESALDQQRYYDLLGYLYTADPHSYGYVAQILPNARLNKLALEYPRKQRNWNRLLAPYRN